MSEFGRRLMIEMGDVHRLGLELARDFGEAERLVPHSPVLSARTLLNEGLGDRDVEVATAVRLIACHHPVPASIFL
jgi:hypothetical protein